MHPDRETTLPTTRSRRPGRALAAVCAIVGLTLTGCAANDTAGADGSSAAAATAKTADLDFTAQTLAGTSFEGRRLQGKPTVLWFWAPWCPTCRAQASVVSRLATEYAGEVNVVGVGGLADRADISDFAAQVSGPTFLVDVPGSVWKHFGVTAQSTYLVVDAQGGVVARGYLDDSTLSARVAELAG